MAKRTTPKKRLKPVPKKKQPKIDWNKVLSKQTKTVLIDTLEEIIMDDRTIERRLTQEFGVEQSSGTLIEQTREAIAEATDYDERRINHNFDYDYQAYDTVQKNLEKLIKAGQLEPAMELALELMKSGSEQVEMSDEGLMTDDIEDCLRVVIKAVKSSNLSVETQRAWAQKMQNTSCVDFICDEELSVLGKGPS